MTKNNRTKPVKKKRTLAMIGSLLLLSAAFRIATDAGQVIASERFEAPDQDLVDLSHTTDLARPKNMEAVLDALKEREIRVQEREEKMAARTKEIEEAERSIQAELKKLEQAEQSLRRTITLASEAAENDVAQLTSVYSDMKPKQAAALFEQMDPGFAAGFLARMPSDSAARIMAGMTPEQAYIVSVELAGRNADIPME